MVSVLYFGSNSPRSILDWDNHISELKARENTELDWLLETLEMRDKC